MTKQRIRAGEALVPPPGYRHIQEVRQEPIPTAPPQSDGDDDPQTPDECDDFSWNLYRIGPGGQRSLIRTLPSRPWETDAAPYGAGIYAAIPLSPRTRRPLAHLEQMLSVDDLQQQQQAPAQPFAPPSGPAAIDVAGLFTVMLQQQAQREAAEAARRDRERIEQQERDEREQRRREQAEDRRRQDFRELAGLALPLIQSVMQRPESSQTNALLEQLRQDNVRLQRRIEAERQPTAIDKYMEFAVQRKMMKEIAADEAEGDDDEDTGVMGAIAGVAKAALPMLAGGRPVGHPTEPQAPALPPPQQLTAADVAQTLRDPTSLQAVIMADPDAVLGSLTELARRNPDLGRSIASQVRRAAATAKDENG